MHHFNFLAETVVSDLKAGASLGRSQHVRIWSAACSTGEESYSIAISLLEAFRDGPSTETPVYQPGGWRIEVVASDIDPVALATAAQRIYNEDSLAGVPLAVKKRYFLRGTGDTIGRVRVKEGLAELVHFQRVDLNDSNWAAVEGQFDVIFFRKALIYLNQETQERFLRKMLHYLKPHGYLILGHSDDVPWLRNAALPIGHTIRQLRPHGRASYTGKQRRRNPRG